MSFFCCNFVPDIFLMTRMTELKSSKRLPYFDTAKAFGILAVVWGHTMKVGWTYSLFSVFRIPLFFYISGRFFNKDKYPTLRSLLSARWKRLMVPYFIYSLVVYAFWAIGALIGGHTSPHEFWYWFYEIFLAQGSGGFLLLYPMWFVPCLLMVEIIYFYIAKLPDWANLLCSFGLAIGTTILLYSDVLPFDLRLAPWSIDSAMLALPFYSIGNLSRQLHLDRLLERSSKWSLWGVWVLSMAVMTVLSLLEGKVSLGHADLGVRPYLFYFAALAGIIGVMVFCYLINEYLKERPFMRGLNWIGQLSYDVMATHVPIKCGAAAVIAWIFGTTVEATSTHFGLAMATFVLTVPVVLGLVWGIDKVRTRIKG